MAWECAEFCYQDWIDYLHPCNLPRIRNPNPPTMLSNIASYLGFGAPAGPEEQENVRVTAVDAEEDGWLVVEAVSGSSSRSRSSSLDSAVEETWDVTPPPCFTSVGPVTVETSPLENLLIEHPSMSVYRRVRRSPSPREVEVPSPVEQGPTPTPPRHPLRPANSPVAPPAQAVLSKRALKAQFVKENQLTRPKCIERGNKSREYNKRNKKLRRADRQQKHSGANNNRKCC